MRINLNKDPSLMANPMDGFNDFQQALKMGMPVHKLDAGYVGRYDEIDSGKRYCYAKVVDGEVQALATFGQEEPIGGVSCYSVNYSVGEKHRRRGLAVEVVNKGIEELKKEFGRLKIKSFHVDAMIDVTNDASLGVARKLFSGSGLPKPDAYSGTPALYFNKLIVLD